MECYSWPNRIEQYGCSHCLAQYLDMQMNPLNARCLKKGRYFGSAIKFSEEMTTEHQYSPYALDPALVTLLAITAKPSYYLSGHSGFHIPHT